MFRQADALTVEQLAAGQADHPQQRHRRERQGGEAGRQDATQLAEDLVDHGRLVAEGGAHAVKVENASAATLGAEEYARERASGSTLGLEELVDLAVSEGARLADRA